MTPINPYISGNPVGGGAAFVGRTSMGRKVRAVLSSPAENALVLYGQRRIGKTSVLQDLKARLPHEGPYRPVLFDLQDKAALPLAQVVQELAIRLAHELALPAPPAWGEDAPRAFREDFLPQVLAHLAEGSILVLLFDEFDVLDGPAETQAGASFFPYLRELLTLDVRRLKFFFVIGRRPEELSSLTLSVFKGVALHHVSLLPPDEAAALARLAERNDTLRWADEAVARVLELAGGHPLLTQQLCSLVWERAYQDDPDEPPVVGPDEVEAAVPRTLGSATNALEWLWNGLQPAQRVVASALAGAGPVAISEEQLEQRLMEGGVRIFMRELRDAPRVLQDWALLEPVAEGYRFRVELLRRWIADRKPLNRVQEEVDRIQPRAESLYQAALGDYRANDLEQASDLLRRALNLHPHHLRANELLADILIEQGNLAEARERLEKLYEQQPAAARSRLVQVLLSLAEEAAEEGERLALFVVVLQVDRTNQKASAGYRGIWKQRGERTLEAGQLEKALYAYQKAGLGEEARHVETIIERKKRVGELYEQALAEWHRGDKAAAERGFAEVVELDPDYREATRYLQWVTTGVDPEEIAVVTPQGGAGSSANCLQAWNPLDSLRLLWWLCMAPEYLKAHREQFGEAAERGTSTWLTNTLFWLPLFIPMLALGLGLLPLREGVSSSIPYLWGSVGLLPIWLFTGSLSLIKLGGNKNVILLSGVMAIMIAVVIASILTNFVVSGAAVVVAGAIGIVSAAVLVGGMAPSVARNLTVSVAVFLAFCLVFFTTLYVIGFLAIFPLIFVKSLLASNTDDTLIVNIGAFVGFMVAVVVAVRRTGPWSSRVSQKVVETVKQGKATLLTRTLFFLLLASYGFVVWFSFFSGWRLFSTS